MPFKILKAPCDDNTETVVLQNIIGIHSRRSDKCRGCAETIRPGAKAYLIVGVFGFKYCSVAHAREFSEARD